jgi:galactonate dehydratase
VKITGLDTIRLAEYPNLIWVLVHTDEGLTGLGETFFGAQAVEAYIHESAAPYLLGQDPLRIDRHSRDMVGYVGFRSSGVETRGNSAVDIALWASPDIPGTFDRWDDDIGGVQWNAGDLQRSSSVRQ